VSSPLFDGPKRAGNLAIGYRCCLLPNLAENSLDIGGKPLGGPRLRGMLVDDAACRGFRGRCQGCRGLRHILVDESCEAFWPMSRDRTVHQEKQLLLALGQLLNRWEQRRKIALLLPSHNSSRMFARRREISTVARASNLHEPLRAAAHRTDVLFQSWTRASRLALIAQRAKHSSASHTKGALGNATGSRALWEMRRFPYNYAQKFTIPPE
jgi:hypothetical protein